MASSLQRFLIACAWFGFASVLPATVSAQCPGYLKQWGANGQFIFPGGVATDAAGDAVVDEGNRRIQKFTNAGVYVTEWGSFGYGDGQFAVPSGIATDSAGNVYRAIRLSRRGGDRCRR